MATNLGKVGMVTKGAYNSANAYEVLDVINYNGATYIAKQDVPAGTLPTNTSYWQEGLNPTYKIKEFTYTYGSATTAGTQVNVSNAKVDVFGLTASQTIVGISVLSAVGNLNFNFNFQPVYLNTNNTFMFVPTANNSTSLTITGIVIYK